MFFCFIEEYMGIQAVLGKIMRNRLKYERNRKNRGSTQENELTEMLSCDKFLCILCDRKECQHWRIENGKRNYFQKFY